MTNVNPAYGKDEVRDFWNQASCGEELFLPSHDKAGFEEHTRTRYRLEPEILEFAGFEFARGREILEIGVGLGGDHQQWAEHGAVCHGVDLTPRAIKNTSHRLGLFGLKSDLRIGDAENLPFEDNKFDIVYSWGVLMCTPDTQKAINEVFRVLKPGGVARIMLYHKQSFIGYMLWLRYALLRFRPFTPLLDIYMRYLESPGTKAYTPEEAHQLFSKYREVRIDTFLCHGDLLTSPVGQRHRGPLLSIARLIWPRWFIRTFFPKRGLFMTISAVKPFNQG